MFPEIDKIITTIEELEGPEAAEWCRQMLDPLHHKIMGRTPVGPPSKTREPVLVFADTISIPISIPAAFNAALPWSFVAQIFPDFYATEYNLYNRDQNNLVLVAANVPVNYGGILIIAFQGTNNCQWTLPYSATQVLMTQWTVSSALVSVKAKTMCVSLKIENNTAPLYAGGAIHAARHNEGNSAKTTSYTIQNSSGGLPAVVLCDEEFSYPVNTLQLAYLPGYMDGDAIDGSMNVVCADVWQEAALPDYTHTIFESAIPPGEPNNSQVFGPVVRTSGASTTVAVPSYRNIHSDLKPMQQWYQNVTPQSTFTARIDAISAAFYATNVNAQLENVSLLRKATPYCPKAMNLVSLLLRDAPAMGKASDNSSFNWLKKVIGNSRGDVSDILGMIPHPIAQGASMIWDAFKPNSLNAQGQVPGRYRVSNDGGMLVSGGMPQPNAPRGELQALQRSVNIHGPFANANYAKGTKTRNSRNRNNNFPSNVNPTLPMVPSRNSPAYVKAFNAQNAANAKTLKNRKKREKKKIRRALNTL